MGEEIYAELTGSDQALWFSWWLIMLGLICQFGFIYGMAFYVAFFYIVTGMARALLGLERFKSNDLIFVSDDKRGRANIIAFQRCSKISDPTHFKKTFM